MHTTKRTNYEIARSLLRKGETDGVFVSAEDDRSWSRIWTPALRKSQSGGLLDLLWDRPLMRTYDCLSGSQPDSDHHWQMLARAPEMRLDTVAIRRETLARHADHRDWQPTPYISFTSSPHSVEILANARESKRGDQHIVVVDPRVRFELEIPLLRYADEMQHYGIRPPYSSDYWTDHYLYLWAVMPAEVVGIWSWEELRHHEHWYQDIIAPAVATFRQDRKQKHSSVLEHDGSG